mmetsp:Transcript_11819/g.17744  ORF Transcript_11819/g.17744 Transcript_11819/m.17744 type:complete len:188 (-) Transcript_11819:110-673(-)
MVCLHVQDNMHVIRTEDLSHTVTSLQALHWQVVRRFQSGDCGDRLQLLGSFQRTWTKRPASSAREVFGAQLRQIRGCSVAASLAIMNRFGTTAGFVAALRGMERLAAEVMMHTWMHCMLGSDELVVEIVSRIAEGRQVQQEDRQGGGSEDLDDLHDQLLMMTWMIHTAVQSYLSPSMALVRNDSDSI